MLIVSQLDASAWFTIHHTSLLNSREGKRNNILQLFSMRTWSDKVEDSAGALTRVVNKKTKECPLGILICFFILKRVLNHGFEPWALLLWTAMMTTKPSALHVDRVKSKYTKKLNYISEFLLLIWSLAHYSLFVRTEARKKEATVWCASCQTSWIYLLKRSIIL